MVIDHLQGALPVLGALPETGAEKRAGTASAFDALLGAAGSRGTASGPARQAAAELLRMEMMQRSLSLCGDSEAPPASGVEALGRVLCRVAGAPAPLSAETATGANRQVGSGAAGNVEGIGDTAREFLGTPYRFGGEGADGIDCSSFVQQVFREHQIPLPRTAREQRMAGQDVPAAELRKGDLVFFQTYASYPSHVGIYLGDGKMIHASALKGEVTVSDINSEYYRSRFLGATRVS
jgi:cell wall-associated NlpC family hydrolase